ncbi:MAG: polyprenyl synthetase family protein [Candidatus Zipacnadales bacterium]
MITREMALVEAEIGRIVSARTALIPQVHQYLSQAGGKRLRPRLTILAAKAIGECTDRAILFAALVEITHLASLLHDDVVDESALRRGRPSVNAQWGNGVAVLMADWLIAQTSHELIAREEYAALEILARSVRDMCEAELAHIEQCAQDWQLPEETYIDIIRHKTGALMAAACELGGLAGGATAEQLQALQEFGLALGTAFQIQDDLLDLSGDTENLGKPVGTDIAMGHLTLPVLYALENSSDGLLEELKAAVTVASPEQLDLVRLRRLVEEAGGIAYARQVAAQQVEEAVESLRSLPSGPATSELARLAQEAICRTR